MPSATAIGLAYAPSRWLQRAMMLVAALAVLGVMSCALPLWIRWVLTVAVLLATWWTRRRLLGSAVRAAGWGTQLEWTLRLADNEDLPAQLVSFRVLGRFVLLRLRARDPGVHALLLGPDNSDADIRRRLPMRLATVQPGEALPRL